MARRIKWLGTPGGKLMKCSECDNKTRYWQPEAAIPLCDVCAGKYRYGCEASPECGCQWCIARRKAKEERDAAATAKASHQEGDG